nr:magnesium/cobalt transporter CorA [Nakamurella flava]
MLPSLRVRQGLGRVRPPLPSGVDTDDRAAVSRESALVDCAAYIDGRRVACDPSTDAAKHAVGEADSGFVWLGLFEPEPDEMAAVARQFGLHELAVEDAVHAYQRPKLDRYREYLFMVFKTVTFREPDQPDRTAEVVETGEVMVFLGRRFVITVRHGEHQALGTLRARLESHPDQLALGPVSVLHAIADNVVDRYVEVIAALEDDIDEAENAVFNPDRAIDIEEIYRLKQQVLQLRRSVAPLANPLHVLSHTPHPLLPAGIREYFSDVEDHLSGVREQVNTADELLTTLINAALTEVTTRQNEDMRKISAWAAIALIPTAIAGIYGMNFENMPELTWTYGYPMALGLIVTICTLLYVVLRRKGWL